MPTSSRDKLQLYYNMQLRLQELEYAYQNIQLFNHIICSNKFTWCFHKQNYYMFYRHANIQRTYCSIIIGICKNFLNNNQFPYIRLIRFKLENILPQVHLCLFSFNPLHKTKYASTKMTVLQAIPASSLCVQGGGGDAWK